MPEPKVKSERTALLGVNNKASPYLIGKEEFLDLRNYDFQTPGALTQRWGSTQYIGQTFAGQINSLYEFEKLDGASYIFTSHSGGIWYGATTGQYQGLSLLNVGATLKTEGSFFRYEASAGGGGVFPLAEYIDWNYLSNIKTPIGPAIGSTNSVGFQEHVPPLKNFSNKLDYVTFQDYLYLADGDKFAKFNGVTLSRIGLPYPQATANGNTRVNPTSGTTLIGTPTGDYFGATVIGNAANGSFQYYISLVNDRGFESQIWPIAIYLANSGSYYGASLITSNYDVQTPLGYGISAVNLYSYWSQGTTTLWNPGYVFRGQYPATGSTITTIPVGTTIGGFSALFNNVGDLPDVAVNSYFSLGTTLVRGSSQNSIITEINQVSYFPKMLEVYKNRLFAAGFSSALSTVKYTDLGEPEGFKLANDFEVRTNDGDIISSLKAYSTRLYIFKRNSFQALYGDQPSNFYLQEISQSYGCLNNRCAVIYNDLLVFLDRSGIMQYNGSNLASISDKINSTFDRMNYVAALENACMVHDKLRNQILIAIPVDGSTLNNLTITYDYMSNAWTFKDGFTPSVFAAIKGYNNTKNAFYGTPSGVINWFGPSFMGDNGVGFTLMWKSSYFHDMGETTTEQYRRLYTNITPIGATITFAFNFYPDYGTSIAKSATVSQFEFQNRYEYGIPAKSMCIKAFTMSGIRPVQITAISTESRLQRRV